MKQWPNFFLIGAPKCGTTALSEYLRQHPAVLFSRPKEPHFFNEDFSYSIIHSWESYVRCFGHGTGQELAVGEGSNGYLYSCKAVPNIIQLVPDARFIVLLRDPVEASYSLYCHNLWEGTEHIRSFEAAWEAQTSRGEGRVLSRFNWKKENLQYGPMFSYGEQLKRLFQHAEREQVLVMLYDDLKKDADAVYQRTLDFLGLHSFHLPNYERINVSRQARWPALQPILRLGLHGARRVKHLIGWHQGIDLARIPKLTSISKERPPLNPEFRAQLVAYFQEDVTQTADLIRRDLSGWARE